MFLSSFTEYVAEFLVAHWPKITTLGIVGLIALGLDVVLNIVRRSLSRAIFQQIKKGKLHYNRWATWLQGDYHPGLAETKQYFVDRPYARDLPRERVKELSEVTENGIIEDWPHEWPPATSTTIADRFVDWKGAWLRGPRAEKGQRMPEVHLIVGNGGMGKSELLSYLFVRVAQHWRNFVPFFASRPIYLYRLSGASLPWEANGDLSRLSGDQFNDAVLLFDDLGLRRGKGDKAPAAVIREAMTRYPNARCLMFAGRATDLLPYWTGLTELRDEAEDVFLRMYHLLPFRPEEEAERFIERRFSWWGSDRAQARELVAKHPVFQRPLFLSYLPLCLGKIFDFDATRWDNFDFAAVGAVPPPEGLFDNLTIANGYHGEDSWQHQIGQLRNPATSGLSETEQTWVRQQSPYLWDKIFQVAGPNADPLKNFDDQLSLSGELLRLVVDQWLFREIYKAGKPQDGVNRTEDVHAFCRKWAVHQFRRSPQEVLSPFPWQVKTAEPKRGFGSVLERVYSQDTRNNFYRFAHRSIANYFIAGALLRDEITLQELWKEGQAEVVQLAGELYVNSYRGKVELQKTFATTPTALAKQTEVSLSFSDFQPLLLAAFTGLKKLRMEEAGRTVVELSISEDEKSTVLRWLRKLGGIQALDLSGLELEDDDLSALTFCSSVEHLKLNDNKLTAPNFELFPPSLVNLDLSKNPLSEATGEALLAGQKNVAQQILLGENSFPVAQVLAFAKQEARIKLNGSEYRDFRGAPLAYLVVDELPPKEAKAVLSGAYVNVDLQGKAGWTALMIACQHNDASVVELLLGANADIDQQTEAGWTALMSACQNEQYRHVDHHQNLLALLATGKCSLHKGNNQNVTALEIAVYFERHHNARALRAAQDGNFDYDVLLAEWEAYKTLAGIPTYTLAERKELLKSF